MNRNIFIQPHELKNLHKTITWKVNQLKGECVEDKGYITSIKPNSIKFGKGIFQSCGGLFMYKTQFDSEFYMPKEDEIIEGEVVSIVPSGIFIQTQYFKVLTSVRSLPKNAKLLKWGNDDKLSLIIDHKIYKTSIILKVKISIVRYNSSSYQVLGDLNENYEDKGEDLFNTEEEIEGVVIEESVVNVKGLKLNIDKKMRDHMINKKIKFTFIEREEDLFKIKLSQKSEDDNIEVEDDESDDDVLII